MQFFDLPCWRIVRACNPRISMVIGRTQTSNGTGERPGHHTGQRLKSPREEPFYQQEFDRLHAGVAHVLQPLAAVQDLQPGAWFQVVWLYQSSIGLAQSIVRHDHS